MKGEPMTNAPSMTITSTTSRETMSDKINRLIRRELDAS